MKHLCIDVRMWNHSGIGTYLQNIFPFLEKSFEISVVGNIEILSLEPFEKHNKITFSSSIYSIKEQLEYSLRVPHCDIFWSPHYNAPFFWIKAKKKIATIHDVFHLANFQSLTILQKLYAKVITNNTVKTSDLVLTVSDFSANEICRYTNASPSKINVVHNGIDAAKFIPKSDQNMVASKYNLPERFLLYVGNVKPHKNIKLILTAFKQRLIEDEDLNLVIVGKKEGFITNDIDIFQIINEGNLSNKVFFTGYVESIDLSSIYNLASVFIFPSLYEGFGLPPLEAMSCKVPTLVSEIDSVREVCGDASLYFNPNDVRDFANKINHLIKDSVLQELLITKGTERVKLFSWKKSAKQHIDLFENI